MHLPSKTNETVGATIARSSALEHEKSPVLPVDSLRWTAVESSPKAFESIWRRKKKPSFGRLVYINLQRTEERSGRVKSDHDANNFRREGEASVRTWKSEGGEENETRSGLKMLFEAFVRSLWRICTVDS